MTNTFYYKHENITEIKIFDKIHNTDYKFHNQYSYRKWYGKKVTVNNVFEYFNWGGDSIYTIDEVLNEKLYDDGTTRYVVEDNKVYYKPKVVIKFSHRDQTSFVKRFNSITEANNWVKNNILKKYPTVSESLIKLY